MPFCLFSNIDCGSYELPSFFKIVGQCLNDGRNSSRQFFRSQQVIGQDPSLLDSRDILAAARTFAVNEGHPVPEGDQINGLQTAATTSARVPAARALLMFRAKTSSVGLQSFQQHSWQQLKPEL